MCPLPPLANPTESDLNWSDEQIVQFLDECSRGSRLPSNVLADSSPYQYPPAYLPEGIWYLVQSNAAKESDFGFWEANGEACKIYSSSMMSGWRTTLQYFEGKKPHGKRTKWLMQEYKVTREELLDKNNKIKDAGLLCRVFLSSENPCSTEISLDCRPLIELEQKNSVALNITNAEIRFCDDSKSDAKEKNCVLKSPPAYDKETIAFLENFSEQECFARGDFLELNDLEDPYSHSSSSQNSSCPSKLSDEYFDSLALLRDLEEENDTYLQEESSSVYNSTTSTLLNDLVVHPDSSGCLLGDAKTTSVEQASQTADLPNSTGGSVLEHTTKRQKPESQTEGTSTSSNEASSPSSSDKESKSNGEKKASSGRMKKLKMYFCLSLF